MVMITHSHRAILAPVVPPILPAALEIAERNGTLSAQRYPDTYSIPRTKLVIHDLVGLNPIPAAFPRAVLAKALVDVAKQSPDLGFGQRSWTSGYISFTIASYSEQRPILYREAQSVVSSIQVIGEGKGFQIIDFDICLENGFPFAWGSLHARSSPEFCRENGGGGHCADPASINVR